jgi:hypothetical protein
MVMRIIKNRKGWVELVEVFITILLLTGVLFVVIGNTRPQESEITSNINAKEISILRDIELNNSLRTDILNINLPVEWAEFDSGLPGVKNRILFLTPGNLECTAKVCELNDICTLSEVSSGNTYVKSLVISADSNTYSPRQLKLFCKEKENS